MKKTLLTAIFSFFAIFAMAQSDKQVIYTKPFTPEHEVRLSYSPISLLDISSYSYNHDSPPGNYKEKGSASTGAWSAIYTYKLRRWLEIGAAISFSGYYVGRYQFKEKVGGYNQTYVTINPNIRFSWFNSRSIRLYSSFAIGMGVLIHKDNSDIVKDERSQVAFVGQFTPFGFSAGRKVFFFLEPFCIGSQGSLVVMGLGYRFPAKEVNNNKIRY